MKCYRVLVRDQDGQSWWPIIRACDIEGVTVKVSNIYPGSTIVESFILHEMHTRWGRLYPEAPVESVGLSGGGFQ